MQLLWAPWRMQYIGGKRQEGCLFCTVSAEQRDAENLILARGERCFTMLNAFPYNNGHLMVAPYRHTCVYEELEPDELLDMMRQSQLAIRALKEAFAPHGFNTGMNLGEVGGAGIADHLHYHVVPRWNGDTNFMPVIADTKVLPEALESTYQKLKAAIDRIKG